jgi:hypothetical protein
MNNNKSESENIGEGFMNWINSSIEASARVYEPIIDELRTEISQLKEIIYSLEKSLGLREWEKFRKLTKEQSDMAFYCQILTKDYQNTRQIRSMINSLIFKATCDFMRDPDKGLNEVWEIADQIIDKVISARSTMFFIRSQLSKKHKEALVFNQKYESQWKIELKDAFSFMAEMEDKKLPLSYYID